MLSILSKNELENYLYHLRDLTTELDYSQLNNVTFFNIESFYSYMENAEGNPFKNQYEELQKIMDIIEPYLPFAIGNTAIQFLTKATFIDTDQEMEQLKAEYAPKVRMDFFHLLQNLKSEEEWLYILQLCESIRQEKEQNQYV
ncbi:MAG: hypothetical protein GX238_05215 [Epulopiscium sp.]|nr:hypothetical protein [Candidatus Epulonipiscium sp.]